jgi:putative transposase
MPWKETCAMSEREAFVVAALGVGRVGVSVGEVCRAFGISRKTGYKWLARHHAEGLAGLGDRSRARRTQEHAVSDEVLLLLLDTRARHPTWGAKKLLPYLQRRHTHIAHWPALSTIGDILRRHGLTKTKSARRARAHSVAPCLVAREPNDVWTMDFKGQVRTLDGATCWPLTIADAFSRKLLAVRGMRAEIGRNRRVNRHFACAACRV